MNEQEAIIPALKTGLLMGTFDVPYLTLLLGEVAKKVAHHVKKVALCCSRDPRSGWNMVVRQRMTRIAEASPLCLRRGIQQLSEVGARICLNAVAWEVFAILFHSAQQSKMIGFLFV